MALIQASTVLRYCSACLLLSAFSCLWLLLFRIPFFFMLSTLLYIYFYFFIVLWEFYTVYLDCIYPPPPKLPPRSITHPALWGCFDSNLLSLIYVAGHIPMYIWPSTGLWPTSRGHIFRENWLSLSSSYQMPVAPQWREGIHGQPQPHAGILSILSLHRSCECCHTCNEFICTIALLFLKSIVSL